MASGVALSVIVPTCNRCRVLMECLRALSEQTLVPELYQVIVVDDGSTDDTAAAVSRVSGSVPYPLVYLKQPNNRGPAAARNRGVREAKGDIVLFIGDDILSDRDLLAQHLDWHRQQPDPRVAILGYVTWSPDIKVTPFMRWLENGGPQFGYGSIKEADNVSWRHFITANLSLKRGFLLNNGLFDEDFPYAAYEDMELGFRLNQRQMRLLYNEKAVAYHCHPTSVDDALRRMVKVGEALGLYLEKTGAPVPQDKRGSLRKALAAVKFSVVEAIASLGQRRLVMPAAYSYLMDVAERRGLQMYLTKRQV